MERVASPGFQSWAARFPLTRRQSRKDAEQLFDLVAGFTYSQILYLAVDTGLLTALRGGPERTDALARKLGMSIDAMDLLCQGAASLKLIEKRGDSRFRLARLGAATLGVPGLTQMIRHHDMFYRDLSDPKALLAGQRDTKLAAFWPYVKNETSSADVAAEYTDLMANSLAMVAEETLNVVDLSDATHILDIGGSSGGFLKAVRARYASPRLAVLDLPEVIATLPGGLAEHQIELWPGSFKDPLPEGPDTISLIRVLYDHDDQTVNDLLANVFASLPPGGQVVISEPMSGGARPDRFGDVYFALYTRAMKTGKTRSAEAISTMLSQQGFEKIQIHKGARSFITCCLSARRPV